MTARGGILKKLHFEIGSKLIEGNAFDINPLRRLYNKYSSDEEMLTEFIKLYFNIIADMSYY